MKTLKITLMSVVMAAGAATLAAPAFAGGMPIDMPRLNFPDPKPVVTQSCETPILDATAGCEVSQ